MTLNKAILRDSASDNWLEFEQPVESFVAWSHSEVAKLLATVNACVDKHQLYAVGFVTFEAAAAFDRALVTQPRGIVPLAVFSLFRSPIAKKELAAPDKRGASHTGWTVATSRDSYVHNIGQIKKQIELGNCYQVNFTVRQSTCLEVSPWEMFCDVAADAPYAAYLDCGEFGIVSASPELFFSLQGCEVLCRPMKGTASRGLTTADDRNIAKRLYESAKDRAENIMITDMVRNDLGKVARPGTVVVNSLFDVEKYPTVWQMTSTVTAQTASQPCEIFAALFPCASVTGAPKAASMRNIADLEASPREIYTGAIGYIAPSRRAQFSVAIRTAWVDNRTNIATYGIGSGVVWDSQPDAEYEECLSKAAVLTTSTLDREFELLETLLWRPDDGYFLLGEHLARLRDSANYFEFRFDERRVSAALAKQAESFDLTNHRVRIELNRNGLLRVSALPIRTRGTHQPTRLRLAAAPINRNDRFLYHKTTRRQVYEQALQSITDCDDVLLWNEDGFITETSIANVVMDTGENRVTPPVECGLLNGTYRRWLLNKGEIIERPIHIDELEKRRWTNLNQLSTRRVLRTALIVGSTPSDTGSQRFKLELRIVAFSHRRDCVMTVRRFCR